MTAGPRRRGSGKRPGEFELIDRYFRPLASDPGALDLTDDIAVYRQRPGDDLVLTADMLAADVHFFADDPPASIARKALRVNLSDLAAKGAEPFGYLLSLALPAGWTEAWIRDFVSGLRGDQKRYGVSLLGGDTIKAAGGLTISITAIGRIPKGSLVTRGGAEAGDAVFVSGTIGDAALGLRLRTGSLKAGRGGSMKHLRDRYLHPQPRVDLAPVVRRHANSAMDVSDGLVGDLGHICAVSGVGAEIEAAAVPLSAAARRLAQADESVLLTILTGGDDYEILATVPETAARTFAREARSAGVPATRIGKIVPGAVPPVVLGADGTPLHLAGTGHAHF
ncbi:thiamine-phosphate kinase [soil metagenome]